MKTTSSWTRMTPAQQSSDYQDLIALVHVLNKLGVVLEFTTARKCENNDVSIAVKCGLK